MLRSASEENCDEFIYYDDLMRAASQKKPRTARGKKAVDKEADKREEAVERVLEIVQSHEQDYDPLWGSIVKQTIKRVYPGFSEAYYGDRTFGELLEHVAEEGAIRLEYDDERGNYKVIPVSGH